MISFAAPEILSFRSNMFPNEKAPVVCYIEKKA